MVWRICRVGSTIFHTGSNGDPKCRLVGSWSEEGAFGCVSYRLDGYLEWSIVVRCWL